MIRLILLTTGLTLLPYPVAHAQVILTNLGQYSQDFNTLASSGTSSSVPTGWAFLESGSSANNTYAASSGSNTPDTLSFGAASGPQIGDRAFGSLQNANVASILGARFQNSTGQTITGITITYTGEQWRLGAINREDRLDFQYSTNASTLESDTGTWIDFNALDFVAPLTTGNTGGKDGNAAANRTTLTASIPLSVANGKSFWIRWTDFDATGNDDGLGVDDFSLTPTAVPEPSTFVLTGAGLVAAGWAAYRTRRAARTPARKTGTELPETIK